jgi:hypothetical protein
MFTIDSITTVNPGVSYHETSKFEWIEDFEDAPMSLIPTSNSDTSMTFFSYDTPVPFLGSRSGFGFVDNTLLCLRSLHLMKTTRVLIFPIQASPFS